MSGGCHLPTNFYPIFSLHHPLGSFFLPCLSAHSPKEKKKKKKKKKMEKVGLAFLPSWGAGHLLPMMEFAKRLLLHPTTTTTITTTTPQFSITVLLIKPPSFTFPSSVLSYLNSLSSSSLDIHFQHLPQVDPPLNTAGTEELNSLFFQSNASNIKSSISSSSPPIAALFVDFFATTVIDAANELGIPTYVYFTSPALMLGLMLHLPTLDEKIASNFEDLQEDIEIPGISSLPPQFIPTPMLKKGKNYGCFLYHGRRFREAKGIIVNTFEEIELAPLAAIAEGCLVPEGEPTPPVYPVGPDLVLGERDKNEDAGERHECIKWLDSQPPASVLFLCFGSRGCFDAPQVKEMALGLEQSGHRFLWSLRTPSPTTGTSYPVAYPTDAHLDAVLPEGFLERTKERGMVWPSWAPQVEILSHQAVGGFVTHCGWNSSLESLWFGVPMLGWPLFAEQHLNEVELVRDIGAAVGLKVDRKRGNFVAAAELERGVRCLMGESEEGKRVRSRVKEIKLASRKAIEKGGSSYNQLAKLAVELCQLKSA